MRVLVIGGTGFIGPHVVRRLVARGHDVTVAHTGAHEVDTLPAVPHYHTPALARGDRARLPERRAELAALAPDVVLDMAPMVERDALATMLAFRGLVSRLVALSSADVYRAYHRVRRVEPGPPDPVPLTEDSPLREHLYPYRGPAPRPHDDPRRWVDDYDKIPVERAVMGDPDLAGTVLRLPMVYGPNDGHRFHPYLKRMDDGRPAILLDEAIATWRWSRGYVENVADAVVLAVTDPRAAGRIYNVAEPDTPTEAAWVRAIGDTAGWSREIVAVPRELLPNHLRTDLDTSQHWEVSTRRIRDDLGFTEATSRKEALRRTIAFAWERSAPPDQIDASAFDYAAEDATLAALARQ